MDFVNKLTGDSKEEEERKRLEEAEKAKSSGGFMDKLSSMAGGKESQKEEEQSSGGFMDKINSMAGGGKESEKKEDALDKGLFPPSLLQAYDLDRIKSAAYFSVIRKQPWIPSNKLC
ncbi:hypothetical protein F5X96DRAFT_236996 [Biscogniauxia mediterranea]|nr:hypothetical protein F5X96DRAFT_236996 [Biscogniauxia mediterranea]